MSLIFGETLCLPFCHLFLQSSEAYFLHLVKTDSRRAYELREAEVDLLKVSLLDLETEEGGKGFMRDA